MAHSTFRSFGYTLLAFALLVAGWMYWRMTNQELWGYAPLAFYLAAFGGTWLLRTYRKSGEVVEDNKLSGLTGLLLGLGFPGILPIPLLLLVAFVPIFVLYRRLITAEASYGRVFRHGFSTFLLFNILASYWVTNTAFGAGVFAMLANSFLMSLPWLAFYWTGRKSPKVAFLAFAACWIAFEHLHYNWGLNWPWLTLGNGFAQWPSLIQWYEVTGVLGGSAWILGCNYLAFKTFFTPAAAPQKKASPLPLALLVALPLIGSLVRYATYSAPAGGTISVASIQPNFEPHFEKFSDRMQSAPLDTFVLLSKAALAVGPTDYLLYPETSFSQIVEGEPLNNRPIQLLQAELKGRGAKYLVTGYQGYKIFSKGEPVTKAVRYFPRQDGSELAV
ncbi:MAG: apolipoprotein N-acyltransferase, partial [Neolewinella sp.]